MKKFFHEYHFVIKAFIVWRIILLVVELFSRDWWQIQFDFLGVSRWANFDGVHYLVIANQGYQQYEEAFFPLYPLLIRFFDVIIPGPAYIAGLIISHAAFLGGLCFFYAISRTFSQEIANRSTVLLLTYPLSFYFAAVYSESLYFLVAAASVYYLYVGRYVLAGIMGAFASATRLFGSLLMVVAIKRLRVPVLLIPLGLIAYMAYLAVAKGDALAFMHVQQYFGANRTSESVVFLPQVLWRYGRILTSVSRVSLIYWVAVTELVLCMGALIAIVFGFRQKRFQPLLLYSLGVLMIPTLTGTFSSIGRYILSAFPIFIYLGSIWVGRRLFLPVVFILGLVIACSLYLAGYFIA